MVNQFFGYWQWICGNPFSSQEVVALTISLEIVLTDSNEVQ